MRDFPIHIVFVLIIVFSPAATEAMEVQLPTLLGTYSSTLWSSSYDFTLTITPIEVYDVWIRFSGSATVAEEYCDFGELEGPYPVPMDYIIVLKDPVSGDYLWWTHCSGEEESGPIEYTLQFEPWFAVDDPNWEFIISGGGTVYLSVGPKALFPECWLEGYPTATIEEATLIINGEFPIAAETHTWGSIKSLFK